MDVSALKGQIKAHNIDKFLIFTGPEWKVQQLYIQQISKVLNMQIKHIESVTDIYSKKGNTAFIKSNYVYVVRDDKEILQNEKVQAQLLDIIGDNTLILLLTTVDKRTKFYRTYKDTIVEFEALKPEILAKYIQKEIELSKDNIEKLMEVCEYDYGRCLLEIDKIKRYVENYYNNDYGADCVEYATGMKVLRITEDKAFEILLKDGTIYTPPKDAIFDFVDAILDRKLSCFDLYEQCKAVGEATMVMVSVLYNNAKAVLQVQTCESKDVSKTTGLSGWQIMNAKKHLNKYTEDELKYIIKLCYRCQKGIISGTLEEQYAMDYILASIL